MIIESTYPLKIGSKVKIAQYEYQTDGNFIYGIIKREATQEEYLQESLVEDEAYYAHLYSPLNKALYWYEVLVD